MTYISRSNNFALYLEEYLIYNNHTYMSQYDLSINVGYSDLHFKFYLEEYLMYKQTYRLWPEAWPEQKRPTFQSPVLP